MKQILVIGGGLIGIRHVESVLNHPGCALAGLVDPRPDLNIDGVTRFSDLAQVSGQVDGVIIATPTELHGAHGIQAAQRGWHMLIEKPVAATLEQARSLKAAVAQAGVRSLVGHHRRYHRSIGQLRALIADGAIGTPITASLIWAMRKPDSYFDGNWRSAGGSPVMINLVHDLDLLRFLLGEISQVAGLRGANIRASRRVESGAVALAFESGATATISFADTAPSPWGFEAATGENPNIGTTRQDMLWITGTQGAVSYPSLTRWSGSDWSRPAAQMPSVIPVVSRAPLDAQLDHFISVLDGQAAPLIDVADATRTLEIALAIEELLSTENAPRLSFAPS